MVVVVILMTRRPLFKGQRFILQIFFLAEQTPTLVITHIILLNSTNHVTEYYQIIVCRANTQFGIRNAEFGIIERFKFNICRDRPPGLSAKPSKMLTGSRGRLPLRDILINIRREATP